MHCKKSAIEDIVLKSEENLFFYGETVMVTRIPLVATTMEFLSREEILV
jgi:hypothetical protein